MKNIPWLRRECGVMVKVYIIVVLRCLGPCNAGHCQKRQSLSPGLACCRRLHRWAGSEEADIENNTGSSIVLWKDHRKKAGSQEGKE